MPLGSVRRQADLASLKAQLRAELQRLEVAEAVLDPPRLPTTLEEIEALEQRLRESLAELEARRAELSRRQDDGTRGNGGSGEDKDA